MKNLYSVCVILILVAELCFSATHYVRAGASGNGSDWNNALDKLPNRLKRGDTYYLADGTYPGRAFSDVGTDIITIKKATASDHGTNTGWNSDYGNGTAEFKGTLSFGTGYYTFDGQWGTGKTSQYGFRINTAPGGQSKSIKNTQNGTNYLTFKHFEFRHNSNASSSSNDGIYFPKYRATNLTLSHVYIHTLSRTPIYITKIHNCLFEYLYINEYGVGGQHTEVIAARECNNMIIRHSTFEKIVSTGGLVFGNCNNVDIYGNVFWKGGGGGGPIYMWSRTTGGGNFRVFNNTFVDINRGIRLLGTGNQIYNNLFYNNNYNASIGGGSHDYNTFIKCVFRGKLSLSSNEKNFPSGSDPFVNYSKQDFRLKTPTDPGKTLASEFNKDMFGKVRGSDGVLDRGAIEYDPGQVTNIKIEHLFSSEANHPSPRLFPNPLTSLENIEPFFNKNNYQLIPITGTGKGITNGIYLIISENNQIIQKVTVHSP